MAPRRAGGKAGAAAAKANKMKSNNNAFDDLSSGNESEQAGVPKIRKRKRLSAQEKEAEKKRRTELRLERRYGPTPAVPELSDDDIPEYDDSEIDDSTLWTAEPESSSTDKPEPSSTEMVAQVASNDAAQVAGIVTIGATTTSGQATVINVNLMDLLKHHLGLSGLKVMSAPAETFNVRPSEMNMPRDTAIAKPNKPEVYEATLLGLPTEMRVRIYRFLLRGDEAVDFGRRVNFSRSSALLATCKQIHEEARAILYGENAFNFARSIEVRGKFYQETWEEIGYKDVRHFLERIGPANVACLKYVSFALTDATARNYPGVSITQRRFVKEPTLHEIFRMIGSKATLYKLSLLFAGRARLVSGEFHFLKALTEMKCHELILLANWRGMNGKIQPTLMQKLKKAMVVPYDDKERLRPRIEKEQEVKMIYETSPGTKFVI
ncbi:hypothetical protein ABEF95_012743 [Exophiala dermatitidis]